VHAEKPHELNSRPHYVIDLIQDTGIKVTRLAHGIPVGGELGYLDEGTLASAIRQRTAL
jgi:recombination protein RecR